MVSKTTELQKSRLFNVLWKKYGKELKDHIVTMEIISSQMWSRICKELELRCNQFPEGEVKLKEIDEYLDMFKMDYDAVVNEFMLLLEYFHGKREFDRIKNKLLAIVKKVKNYKQRFHAQEGKAANAILNVQKVFNLTGDFKKMERIEKVWPYTLSCIRSRATLGLYKFNNIQAVKLHLYKNNIKKMPSKSS